MTKQTSENITPKKTWSRYWKWLIIPLLILLFFASARWLLQSDWLMEQVRQMVEEQASANLNGSLRIGELEGDLLFGFWFSDIELLDENEETVLRVGEISLRYTIPSLVFEPHRLDVVSVDRLELYGEQFEDGIWNFMALLPDLETEEDTETDEMLLWQIHRLEIARSSVSVISPELPDGRVLVSDLQFLGGVGYLEGGWFGTANELRFSVDEGRLLQPVDIDAAAFLQGEDFSLEHLIANTGRTVARTRLQAQGTDQIEGVLALNPLSWLDLDAYLDQPVEQDITAQLTASGSLSDLYLQLDLSADGLESMNLSGRTDLMNDNPSLRDLNLSIANFNGTQLTGDTLMPSVGMLRFDSEGPVFFNNPEESQLSGELTMERLIWDQYELEQFRLAADWQGQSAGIDFSFVQAAQTAEGRITVENLFTDLPEWAMSLNGNQIDAAEWLNNPALESELNITVTASGRGFELSEELFEINLELTESRWGNQPFDYFHFEGQINENELNSYADFVTGGSRIYSYFNTTGWQSEPFYRFTARIDALNAADFAGLENFPTYLNAGIEGEGRYFDLENMELNTTMEFDSSLVNGESIDQFRAFLEIRDQVATLQDAELISPIADAKLFVRQHLLEFRDPENTLDFDLTVKDINPLSPLFGVESIHSSGTMSGRLFRQEDGELQFTTSAEFREIAYDTLFTIDSVRGEADALLLEHPVLNIDLGIDRPGTEAFTLQSIHIQSRATLIDSLLDGNLQISFLQDNENAIHHAGDFRYLEDDLNYITTHFTFQTPDRALDLQQNFELRFREGVVEMDTMHIQSSDGMAFLKLSIPYLDEHRQEVTLDAQQLDLGTLQRSFLDEFYAETLLSGSVEFFHENGLIRTDSDIQFSQIEIKEGRIDSLNLAIGIDQGRLLTNADAWYNGSELLYLRGNLPYQPGDPEEFDESFFEENVEGEFRLNSTPISYWIGFLGEENGIETDGYISFNSEVEGTAGLPLFDGRLDFREGNFSGVNIDSMGVDIQYTHEEASVWFDGDIHSLGTQIARFESMFPLYLDLQAFRVDLPHEEDNVYASFHSENLDIALFNDFLDRDVLRSLQGRLTADLELQGPIADLETRGNVSLRNGSIRVMDTNVTLSEIRSDINFTPDQVNIQNFSMRSGPGNFTANGVVAMDGLEPGNMDLNVQANVFRVTNTPDMNAIVDLRSRLRGTFQRPELTGELAFRSGFFFLPNFGEHAVEDVQLEDEPEPMNIALYDSMAIEMNVSFDRQFFVRNRQFPDMEIELSGDVNLVKQAGGDLEMFGAIQGVRGYAQTLGRNFQLDDAVITFSGPIDNPDLNVRTLYSPPQISEDISIWYIIEGNVENPEFRFESEPFLELQDIISYTIFGQPFHSLDSWQQAISGGGSGGGAADIALDLLLDRVEMLAAQQLGIDVVQIDTNRSASGSSTTIKTGWFIGDRTFFAVLNEISGVSPKTLFMLEYMIRRNLELVVTQGDDSREGVDLRWQYDY